MMHCKGYMGQSVSFDGEWVTIHRKGPAALLNGGRESRLHVSTILRVRFMGGDLQKNGFIEFLTEDRNDRKARRASRKGAVLNPKQSVYFVSWHRRSFEELHVTVSRAIAGAAHGGAPAAGPSLPEQIQQLQTLLHQGALTREQYDQAVAKLTGPGVGG